MPKESAKRPFYKKWWVWVLAVVIIGAIASIGDDTDEAQTSEKSKEIPLYEITEERLDDAGIWYVALSTESRNREELELLASHIKDLAEKHEKKVESSFIKIYSNDDSKSFLASGKFALTQKGLAQTGLEKTDEIEFEYKVSEGEEDKGPQNVSSPQHNGPTADQVLVAFKNASLSVPDERDNSQNCPDLECTKLITTETVSIYEWPSVDKAKQVQDEYNFGTHQAGPIIIRMNDKNMDPTSYINELDKIINTSNQ